jgi:hypothetical protein
MEEDYRARYNPAACVLDPANVEATEEVTEEDEEAIEEEVIEEEAIEEEDIEEDNEEEAATGREAATEPAGGIGIANAPYIVRDLVARKERFKELGNKEENARLHRALLSLKGTRRHE